MLEFQGYLGFIAATVRKILRFISVRASSIRVQSSFKDFTSITETPLHLSRIKIPAYNANNNPQLLQPSGSDVVRSCRRKNSTCRERVNRPKIPVPWQWTFRVFPTVLQRLNLGHGPSHFSIKSSMQIGRPRVDRKWGSVLRGRAFIVRLKFHFVSPRCRRDVHTNTRTGPRASQCAMRTVCARTHTRTHTYARRRGWPLSFAFVIEGARRKLSWRQQPPLYILCLLSGTVRNLLPRGTRMTWAACNF